MVKVKAEVSAKVNTEENEEVNIIDKSQSDGVFELFRLDFDVLKAQWY
jgi:hypothetical protein